MLGRAPRGGAVRNWAGIGAERQVQGRGFLALGAVRGGVLGRGLCGSVAWRSAIACVGSLRSLYKTGM